MKKFIAGALALTAPATAMASGAFKEFAEAMGADIISVTREESNLYKVRYPSILIKTRYCYVYAYSEDAFVYKDTLYFVDEDESCDIEGTYRQD